QPMSLSRPDRKRRKKAPDIMIAAALLAAPLPSVTPSAHPNAPKQTTSPPVALSPEERQRREEWERAEPQKRAEWEQAMPQVPLPKRGCFEASYPNKEWREGPGANHPPHTPPPRRRPTAPPPGGHPDAV